MEMKGNTMIVELKHPPIKKRTAVKLTRRWSEWGEGDIIVTDKKKAERIIKKKYGVECKEQLSQPKAETATAPPAAENAMASPALEVKTPVLKVKTRPPDKEKKGGAD
jgi:hypothetical protein